MKHFKIITMGILASILSLWDVDMETSELRRVRV